MKEEFLRGQLAVRGREVREIVQNPDFLKKMDLLRVSENCTLLALVTCVIFLTISYGAWGLWMLIGIIPVGIFFMYYDDEILIVNNFTTGMLVAAAIAKSIIILQVGFMFIAVSRYSVFLIVLLWIPYHILLMFSRRKPSE